MSQSVGEKFVASTNRPTLTKTTICLRLNTRIEVKSTATARFRWESRVIPFGRMWDQNSSWSLTNLANPGLLLAMGSYYGQHWTKLGVSGAYNDDTNKLLGSNQFDIYSGGNIAELDAIAGSTEADERYKQQFSAFLKRLTAVNDKPLIGLNIGTV